MRLAQLVPNSFRLIDFPSQLEHIRLVRRLRQTPTKNVTARKTKIATTVRKTKKIEKSVESMTVAQLQALIAQLSMESPDE